MDIGGLRLALIRSACNPLRALTLRYRRGNHQGGSSCTRGGKSHGIAVRLAALLPADPRWCHHRRAATTRCALRPILAPASALGLRPAIAEP
eukprot:scaffold34878_cov101-Isochrysis_galbana.AAC.6